MERERYPQKIKYGKMEDSYCLALIEKIDSK